MTKCKNCDKEFEKTPKGHRKTFCCPKCCYSYHDKKNLKPIRMRSCLWCKQEFKVRVHFHRFCGKKDCNGKYKKIQQRIYNVFRFESEKQEKQLQRLEKLGYRYTFPKKFDSLNKLYELNGKTEVIK